MAQKKQQAAQPPDSLDALVATGDVIALMLWQARHREPDMYVKITRDDIAAFEACCEYQKVKPEVLIHRPPGRPAQEAMGAGPGRAGVPGRAADPPKDYVIVTVVAAGTQNAIHPIENNQEDFDKSKAAAHVRKARDQAPMLAENIERAVRTGEWSLSEMKDAQAALLILAGALQ